jgi:hypothetical protein
MAEFDESKNVLCCKCGLVGPRTKPSDIIRCPQCGTFQRVPAAPVPFCVEVGPIELAALRDRQQAAQHIARKLHGRRR